jgi:hypothetical protein
LNVARRTARKPQQPDRHGLRGEAVRHRVAVQRCAERGRLPVARNGGSEFAILQAFDFDAHGFGMIPCEHNFTASRDTIHARLTGKGYSRALQEDPSRLDDCYGYRML